MLTSDAQESTEQIRSYVLVYLQEDTTVLVLNADRARLKPYIASMDLCGAQGDYDFTASK